jgi:hypothetical protein
LATSALLLTISHCALRGACGVAQSAAIDRHLPRRSPRDASRAFVVSAAGANHAIAALRRLLASDEPFSGAESIRCARLLRAAAREERRCLPRTASVALLVSDALMFTESERLRDADRDVLWSAISLMTDPSCLRTKSGACSRAF